MSRYIEDVTKLVVRVEIMMIKMGKAEKKERLLNVLKAGPGETNKTKMGNNILLYSKGKATKEPEKQAPKQPRHKKAVRGMKKVRPGAWPVGRLWSGLAWVEEGARMSRELGGSGCGGSAQGGSGEGRKKKALDMRVRSNIGPF